MVNPRYIGIDPGFTGAIAEISADGKSVRTWDMPVMMRGTTKKYRTLDVERLYEIFGDIFRTPVESVGLENPTTRPGEGAERAARFGRQLGTLEALLYLFSKHYGTKIELVAPSLWTGRLGLPGKTEPRWQQPREDILTSYYPDCEPELRGPRGGLKDGRLDALLIAHWLRTRSAAGMRGIVAQYGKDSPEALSVVLSGGKKRRRKA